MKTSHPPRRIWLMLLGLVLVVSVALAGPAKKKKAKPEEPPKKEEKAEPVWPSPLDPGGYDKLYSELPFSKQKDEFAQVLKLRFKQQLQPILKATLDPAQRDRLRLQMSETFEKVVKSWTEFKGQDTGYTVSVIAKEFKHDIGEAVYKYSYGTNTAYFLFSQGTFWRLLLCVDTETAFKDFLVRMKQQYGEPSIVEFMDEEKTQPFAAHWKDTAFQMDAMAPAGLFSCNRIRWTYVPLIPEVEARRGELKENTDIQDKADKAYEKITSEKKGDVDNVVDQYLKRKKDNKKKK
jgi:hypothetical protein